MFKLFGGRKKPAKAKRRKADSAPRTPPGEGIRQLAAVLPQSDDPAAAPPPKAAERPRAAAPEPSREAAPPPDPATRDTLIREALRIRRDKAKALDDLPVRERKKLRALAEKMMGVQPDPPADPGPAGKPSKTRGPSGTRH